MVFTRMMPDGGGGSGGSSGGMVPDRVVDEAQNVSAVLDDIRELASQVDQTLQVAGRGTADARRDVDLGRPTDDIAQGTVQVATAAQAVFRESVQYLLDSLQNYLDALLAAARQYATTDESVDEALRVFADRVDATSSETTYGEGQAAGGQNGYSGSGSGNGSAPGGSGTDGTSPGATGSDGTGTGTGTDGTGTDGTDGTDGGTGS